MRHLFIRYVGRRNHIQAGTAKHDHGAFRVHSVKSVMACDVTPPPSPPTVRDILLRDLASPFLIFHLPCSLHVDHLSAILQSDEPNNDIHWFTPLTS